MKPFDYHRAATITEARALAAQEGSRFIGGGTNLLDLMKLEIERPAHLIDLNRIVADAPSGSAELDTITDTPDGGLRIGALVRNTDLAAHPRVRQDYGVLSRAILSGASGQIRNRATTAGNLLQRTRCAYFYDTNLPCNKRAPGTSYGGTGCGALAGISRDMAVVGVSESCIAPHPSDMAVALRVLDAIIETVNPAGITRQIPIAAFYRLPGDTPHLETVLETGELITAVTLPAPLGGQHIYRKVRDRASFAFALVSVAAVITESSARFALGGVAPQPWRSEEAEARYPNMDAVADALLAGATPTGQNAFKLPLARRLLHAIARETSQNHAARQGGQQ